MRNRNPHMEDDMAEQQATRKSTALFKTNSPFSFVGILISMILGVLLGVFTLAVIGYPFL